MTHYEVTRRLTDVDAMVTISGVAHKTLVFFEEGVHSRPRESDTSSQISRVARQIDVLPRSSLSIPIAGANGIPARWSEIGMMSGVPGALKSVWRDVGLGKVGHRIMAGLEEQESVFA